MESPDQATPLRLTYGRPTSSHLLELLYGHESGLSSHHHHHHHHHNQHQQQHDQQLHESHVVDSNIARQQDHNNWCDDHEQEHEQQLLGSATYSNKDNNSSHHQTKHCAVVPSSNIITSSSSHQYCLSALSAVPPPKSPTSVERHQHYHLQHQQQHQLRNHNRNSSSTGGDTHSSAGVSDATTSSISPSASAASIDESHSTSNSYCYDITTLDDAISRDEQLSLYTRAVKSKYLPHNNSNSSSNNNHGSYTSFTLDKFIDDKTHVTPFECDYATLASIRATTTTTTTTNSTTKLSNCSTSLAKGYQPYIKYKVKHKRHFPMKPTFPSVRCRRKRTKLIDAINNVNLDKLCKCLASCDPNFVDEASGECPLSLAASCQALAQAPAATVQKIIVALVNAGALLDFRNQHGKTALHLAVQKSNYNALKTLLDLGATPNYKDANGLTPLYYSIIYKSSPKLTQLLLHEHSIHGVCDQQGWQEVHHACKLGLDAHLEQLLYYGCDINARITGS
ncbi:SH3 and multiple ankyrin repeat domains protein 3, partial [Fragariocoptes setiger]